MQKRGQRFSPFTIFAFFAMISSHSVEGLIGINWGRQSAQRLIPSMVVDLLLQNDIRNLRVYSPSVAIMDAFAGADIAVTTTVPTENIRGFQWKPDIADFWLDMNVYRFRQQGVLIKYLYVGSEPFSTLNNGKFDNTIDLLEMLQDLIITKHNNSIKATVPHFTDVLADGIKKPSDADFRQDIRDKMVKILLQLNRTDSPFVMNVFPIHYVSRNEWDTEFAFVDNRSNFTIVDGHLVYTNVFEFAYDSFLHALRKAGFPNLKLTVGQLGWPTDGYPGANVANAERFYKSFLPYIVQKKGTPLRPGIEIDVFVHSLVDESKNGVTLGPYQRHWGVYRANGEPKYKIDFTGRARDVYPTTARGVIRMPRRWCMFNGNRANVSYLKTTVNDACNGKVDCTPLALGGSCSGLDFARNISYVYNLYFQNSGQNTTLCEFEGTGQVVTDDPSVGSCRFITGILSAEQAASARRLSGSYGLITLIVALLCNVLAEVRVNW